MDIQRDDFIRKYNLDVDMIKAVQIDWGKMDDIYADFLVRREQLEVYSNLLAELLRKHPNVHTVRSRIKDPEHLIAKLIRKTPERKKSKGENFEFTIENYRSEITDLIGVRVIHIFKEDWKDIHQFIDNTWLVKELQVNIREGDSRDIYEEQNITINYRETGYRSVHYLVEFSPTNELLTAEIQVRTIFEEGYGEIDHLLSYPNNNVPEVLTLNLLMLNRLAGSADEMSSAVRIIKEEWNKMQDSLISKDDELKMLESRIAKLNIEKQEKDSLVNDIGKIRVDTNWVNNLGSTIYHINTDRIAKLSSEWAGGIAGNSVDKIAKLSSEWAGGIAGNSVERISKIGSEWAGGMAGITGNNMESTPKMESNIKIGKSTEDKSKIQTVKIKPYVDEE